MSYAIDWGALMDLRQLEFFVHVAELGSFTKASNFLSIAQPVLSRHVRALEVELRHTLLERNGRGVTLTPSGARLLEHGRGILAQVERAHFDLASGRNAAAGRLVVALPPSIASALTSTLVRRFRDRFPDATLGVMEGLSSYGLEWVALGRADCAIVYTVPTSSVVDLQPVLNEELYLVERRGESALSGTEPEIGATISFKDLAERPLVIPNRPHSIRMLLEGAMAKASLKPKVALEIESIGAILNLVLTDNFSAVLSLNAIRSTRQGCSFKLRPIGTPALQTTLWLATSAQRPRGPLLNQAVPLLETLLRDVWARGETCYVQMSGSHG